MMQLPFLFALASQPDGCRAITHQEILASDLAAAIPAFSSLPQDLRVGFSPMPGSRRVFPSAELQRIAKVHGLELTSAADLCFSWRVSTVKPEDLIAAMRKTIGIADAKIEILSFSQTAAPEGEIVFPRNGLQLPPVSNPHGDVLWRGYVLYGENRRFGIWAKARIVADVTRVVATADLIAGQAIRQDQVRLESLEEFPLDLLTARNLDEVIGLAPRVAIKNGAPILKNQIGHAPEVARGDVVNVEVRSGAAYLSFEARAETNGAKGATILVRNPKSGRDFRAQVVEKGKVVVIPGVIQ